MSRQSGSSRIYKKCYTGVLRKSDDQSAKPYFAGIVHKGASTGISFEQFREAAVINGMYMWTNTIVPFKKNKSADEVSDIYDSHVKEVIDRYEAVHGKATDNFPAILPAQLKSYDEFVTDCENLGVMAKGTLAHVSNPGPAVTAARTSAATGAMAAAAERPAMAAAGGPAGATMRGPLPGEERAVSSSSPILAPRATSPGRAPSPARDTLPAPLVELQEEEVDLDMYVEAAVLSASNLDQAVRQLPAVSKLLASVTRLSAELKEERSTSLKLNQLTASYESTIREIRGSAASDVAGVLTATIAKSLDDLKVKLTTELVKEVKEAVATDLQDMVRAAVKEEVGVSQGAVSTSVDTLAGVSRDLTTQVQNAMGACILVGKQLESAGMTDKSPELHVNVPHLVELVALKVGAVRKTKWDMPPEVLLDQAMTPREESPAQPASFTPHLPPPRYSKDGKVVVATCSRSLEQQFAGQHSGNSSGQHSSSSSGQSTLPPSGPVDHAVYKDMLAATATWPGQVPNVLTKEQIDERMYQYGLAKRPRRS